MIDAEKAIRWAIFQDSKTRIFDAGTVRVKPSDLRALLAELDRLRGLTAKLQQEAQIHAQEARTANATIYEIYQHVTGATGEPGNWNGAKPVKDYLYRLRKIEGRWRHFLQWAEFFSLGDESRLSVKLPNVTDLDEAIEAFDEFVEAAFDNAIAATKDQP